MPKAFLIRKSISAKELYLSFQWRPVSPPPSPEDEDEKEQPLNLSTSAASSSSPPVPQRVPVIQSASKVHLPERATDLSFPVAGSRWIPTTPAPNLFSPPPLKPSPATLIPVQQPLSLQIDTQSNHSYDSSSSSSSLSDRTSGLKSGQSSPTTVPPTIQILATRLGEWRLPVALALHARAAGESVCLSCSPLLLRNQCSSSGGCGGGDGAGGEA